MATTWGARARRYEPWLAGAVVLGMAVTVGPQAVVGAVDDPGVGNTLYLVLVTAVMVVFGRECVVGLRKRGTAADSPASAPVIVPPGDVRAAVESTGDLVDRARSEPPVGGPAT